jgi:DNA-binding NarL/FixJ family response regulator
VEGHRAKDIPLILHRSANTIKTHNKHIYDKLFVSSREQLLGYMKMMKDEGEVKMDVSDNNE